MNPLSLVSEAFYAGSSGILFMSTPCARQAATISNISARLNIRKMFTASYSPSSWFQLFLTRDFQMSLSIDFMPKPYLPIGHVYGHQRHLRARAFGHA